MRKILMLSLALILISGCSEDSNTPATTPFALNLIVTDSAGARLSGVEAKVHVQIPGLNPSFSKAVTKIPFGIPVDCDVEINVFNMDGLLIQSYVAAGAPAGSHLWVSSIDLDGEPSAGTGYYRYEMIATDGGAELFRASRVMTVYDSFDSYKQPVVGITDSEGRISYGDQTRFPFLYNLGLQPNIDENGQVVGEFEFSDLVAFTLTDTLSGDRRFVEALVQPELNIITLVWNDSVFASNRGGRQAPDHEIVELVSSKASPPPEFFLSQNYPNPFN